MIREYSILSKWKNRPGPYLERGGEFTGSKPLQNFLLQHEKFFPMITFHYERKILQGKAQD
jgi:hypothetical protein